MKFMIMMNSPRGDGDWGVTKWSAADFQAHVGFMLKLNQDLTAAGELVMGEGLSSPAQARLVRAGSGGMPEVTDGPFAEAKEFLAGFWIVDVESAQRAYAIAGRISGSPGQGGRPLNLAVEVREVLSGAPPHE